MSTLSSFLILVAQAFAWAMPGQASPNAPRVAPPPFPQPTPLLICVVPNQTMQRPQVALRVGTSAQSRSTLLVTLVEGTRTSEMTAQVTLDEARSSIQEGQFSTVLLKNDFSFENGVMHNAGFLSVKPAPGNTWEGFLAANGSVYPLSCRLP